MLTRRSFLTASAGFALSRSLRGQFAVGGVSSTTRLDLAKIDRARILAVATGALARHPEPEADGDGDSLLQMVVDVPALAAAAYVDQENAARYEAKAVQTLESWFGAASTRIPSAPKVTGFEQLLGYSQLAEVAVAATFLPAQESVKAWFREYLAWLTTNRTALLARDAKDRHGSSWLLQVAAFARLCGDEKAAQESRVRFRHATLRAEINADGFFPNELRTPDSLRNSLFNLDLLAGCCVLLSTRFESLWDAELQDGPGMRGAVARHAPYIAKPTSWPYPADKEYFRLLPGRRPTLAFAARAYAQPEYAAEFLTLKRFDEPDLLRTLPIKQPVLWTSQPRTRG